MKMALVYSRDSAARPLALLAHVLDGVNQGIFDPDRTGSGRLKANAIPLDQVEAFSSIQMFSSFKVLILQLRMLRTCLRGLGRR